MSSAVFLSHFDVGLSDDIVGLHYPGVIGCAGKKWRQDEAAGIDDWLYNRHMESDAGSTKSDDGSTCGGEICKNTLKCRLLRGENKCQDIFRTSARVVFDGKRGIAWGAVTVWQLQLFLKTGLKLHLFLTPVFFMLSHSIWTMCDQRQCTFLYHSVFSPQSPSFTERDCQINLASWNQGSDVWKEIEQTTRNNR